MIRVLVVDDHTLVRAAVCRLLDGESDIEVVGEADSSAEAVRSCRKASPDVVVLDYSLPDGDGLTTTAAILRIAGHSRVRPCKQTAFTRITSRRDGGLDWNRPGLR